MLRMLRLQGHRTGSFLACHPCCLMVLTRSQHRSLSWVETESVPDEEFWALDAAVRAAEEAFDAIPLVTALPMKVVAGPVPLAARMTSRPAATSGAWLPAPEPRRIPALDARQLGQPCQPAMQSAVHSPRRRLSAPAALDTGGPARTPDAPTPSMRSQTASRPARLPVTSAAQSPPPAGVQSTMHRFLTPRRGVTATCAEQTSAAAADTERHVSVDEALVLPDPHTAMRRSSKRAKKGNSSTGRRARKQVGKATGESSALQVRLLAVLILHSTSNSSILLASPPPSAPAGTTADPAMV